MSTQTKTVTSIAAYSAAIETASQWLGDSDAILIGAGAGLSASGGLDYGDEERAKAMFPAHYACGLTSIMEILSAFWEVTGDNATAFWAVWSRHIYENFYAAPLLQPYKRLRDLVRDKPHFVLSSNVDGQFAKAGFPAGARFEPQGSYGFFQCSVPCGEDVYPNRSMIDAMLANMPSPTEIRFEDIPRCPRCGSQLRPNLRSDNRFVDRPYMGSYSAYASFIERWKTQRLVLLEVGSGFNSPGVIRYPFEEITRAFARACLIRVNSRESDIPFALVDRGIGIGGDADAVLGDLLK